MFYLNLDEISLKILAGYREITSLSLGFSICKMGIIIVPALEIFVCAKSHSVCKAWHILNTL